MIKEPLQYLKLSPEDENTLAFAYERIAANFACMEGFARARERYLGMTAGYAAELDAVAAVLGFPRYTVDLVFLLTCAEHMRKLYEQRGYSESLYRDALADVGVKATECKKVYGIVGIFVLWWYPQLFTGRRFILGRLEYEEFEFHFDAYRDILKKGDRVLKCHIPSSGSLPQESVVDSLKRAYDFYPEIRYNGILPVYCHSWLLYPPTAALYKPGSNLDGFFRDFEVLSEETEDIGVNFWRVFNRPWTEGALANAPEDTSMQRNFKQYLLNGGKMGCGEAILLFDGEKILDNDKKQLYNVDRKCE